MSLNPEEVMGNPGGSGGATSDREIVTTRVFDAPRELVFKMWTEPEHIVHWYGPDGFTDTVYEMDVRPGGAWRHTMHGPDGVDYKNDSVYLEVVPPERLVFRHLSTPLFVSIVTFEAQGAGTRLTLRSVFETRELRDKVAEQYRAVEGASQTLARLGRYLAVSDSARGWRSGAAVGPGGA
jgi:uncharacterized protein YndB with AHSA1/START domain